ncbi:PH domain-containing protein, partial [Streptomyces sp. NPDC048551]
PRAAADQAVDELRELAERGAARPGAQGSVTVKWAYEVIVPAVLGAVALAVLLITG